MLGWLISGLMVAALVHVYVRHVNGLLRLLDTLEDDDV